MRRSVSVVDLLAFAVAIVLAFSSVARAQVPRNLTVSPVSASAHENRYALVIGNDSYAYVEKLKNARADARAIAKGLEDSGFKVTLEQDLNLQQMKQALRNFKNRLAGGDVAVFYYAGHGVQLGAANYLAPIDIRGDSEDQVRDDAIPLQRILDDLQDQKAKFSLAIIDACRNNPFKSAGRAIGGRGLAPTTAATGQMVLYSAGAGQQALDTLGPADRETNGLFTRVFLKEMAKPGIPVDRVLRNVREEVVRLARSVNHEQVPALYDQALGDFYFLPPSGTQLSSVVPVTAPIQAPLPGPAPAPTALRPERVSPATATDPDTALWQAAEGGGTADDYMAYVKQYPKGKFVGLAKQRMQKLLDQAKAQAEAEEEAAWRAAESSQTEAGYQAYAARYPTGRYVALAQPRMNKIRADAALAAEAQVWQRAEAGSKTEVEAYLSKYPTGRYVAAAGVRLEKLKKEESEMRPGKVFRDCADCPEMVVIPAGSFMMGSPPTELGRYDNEGPQHRVTVSEFAMGKTHITRGQFGAFVSATNYDAGKDCYIREGAKSDSYNWRNPGYPQDYSHPVVCLNWEDVKAYAAWLSKKTGKVYRLPSEAEWEYAARAGTTTARYWGESPDQACRFANVGDQTTKSQVPGWALPIHNCSDGYAYTSPVASLKPNGFGLYDMIGNASEWVEGCWNRNYQGAPTDGSAWMTGDNCGERVLRGGAWDEKPQGARSAGRSRVPAALRFFNFGFRLARMLP